MNEKFDVMAYNNAALIKKISKLSKKPERTPKEEEYFKILLAEAGKRELEVEGNKT